MSLVDALALLSGDDAERIDHIRSAVKIRAFEPCAGNAQLSLPTLRRCRRSDVSAPLGVVSEKNEGGIVLLSHFVSNGAAGAHVDVRKAFGRKPPKA